MFINAHEHIHTCTCMHDHMCAAMCKFRFAQTRNMLLRHLSTLHMWTHGCSCAAHRRPRTLTSWCTFDRGGVPNEWRASAAQLLASLCLAYS